MDENMSLTIVSFIICVNDGLIVKPAGPCDFVITVSKLFNPAGMKVRNVDMIPPGFFRTDHESISTWCKGHRSSAQPPVCLFLKNHRFIVISMIVNNYFTLFKWSIA